MDSGCGVAGRGAEAETAIGVEGLDGTLDVPGVRGDSQTSHLTIEGWFKKVQAGQETSPPSIVGLAVGAGAAESVGVPGREERVDGASRLLMTPQRVHLPDPVLRFLKPQTWQFHVSAAVMGPRSGAPASTVAPPSMLATSFAASALLPPNSCNESVEERTRVIFGELFMNPTHCSVCLTSARSRERELRCGLAAST